MALLLTIDTALERGSVGLFDGSTSLGILVNESQKDHAGFVQTAIDQLVQENGKSLELLDAIAVVNGPGSYTGLRVGLATAKGLCYALDKKLILLNTLDLMAFASIAHFQKADYYFAPMIDARREDVFMGIYNNQLKLVEQQSPITLKLETFHSLSQEKKIAYSGSGAEKAAEIIGGDFEIWRESYAVEDINTIAQEKYTLEEFADVAYSEPNYLKAFYTTAKIKP